jgi:hypothetical protein
MELSLLGTGVKGLTIPLFSNGCRPYGVLENVVTHSAHRGNGYGKVVLWEALASSGSAGCYKVMLLTGRNDKAIVHFYESTGFDAHQRSVRGNRDDDPLRDRPGPEPLCQRQALLFVACSWLRLCPAIKISGGKTLSSGTRPSANRARQALKLAAMSLSRSDSALGAFYRRLCARMDKPRANTAVAHKLARMVYFMLTRGEAFVDQGQQRYEEQQRQRSIAALRRRASAPGFQLQPNAPAS